MSTADLSIQDPATLAWLERVQRPALIAGGAGAVLCALAAVIAPRWFLPAYLVAFLFWLGIALGALGAVMLHQLVGGVWGFVIRRLAEAATLTLPLMALLFLPIVLGMHSLYPWADAEEVGKSAALQHKAPYLNVTWFLIRAAIYFAVWIGLALLIRLGSRRQDEVPESYPTRWTQTLSGPGLVLWFLAITFAMVDWAMSLEPEWYSTIYGAMLLVGFSLSALAMLVIVAERLAGARPLSLVATPEGFHDLGNLLLAFTMLWAYISLSQYLIVWMGNLTEEIPWYLRRSQGGWWGLALGLILFHFFLPFFLLLFRARKRRPSELVRVCWVLLAMHFFDLCWLILPAFPRNSSGAPNILAFWGVVPAMVGIGGLWLAVAAWFLRARPLLPLHDPLLEEVFEHHGEDHGQVHEKPTERIA